MAPLSHEFLSTVQSFPRQPEEFWALGDATQDQPHDPRQPFADLPAISDDFDGTFAQPALQWTSQEYAVASNATQQGHGELAANDRVDRLMGEEDNDQYDLDQWRGNPPQTQRPVPHVPNQQFQQLQHLNPQDRSSTTTINGGRTAPAVIAPTPARPRPLRVIVGARDGERFSCNKCRRDQKLNGNNDGIFCTMCFNKVNKLITRENERNRVPQLQQHQSMAQLSPSSLPNMAGVGSHAGGHTYQPTGPGIFPGGTHPPTSAPSHDQPQAQTQTVDRVLPDHTVEVVFPPNHGFDLQHDSVDDAREYMKRPPADVCRQLEIDNDDFEDMRGVESFRLNCDQLFQALQREPARPPGYFDDDKRDYYVEHQSIEHAAILRAMSKDDACGGRNNQRPRDGDPKVDFKEVKENSKNNYAPNVSLCCSERIKAVVRIAASNKYVARDILNGKNLAEIARSPDGYLQRKLDNMGTNKVRAWQLKIAGKVAKGEKIDDDDIAKTGRKPRGRPRKDQSSTSGATKKPVVTRSAVEQTQDTTNSRVPSSRTPGFKPHRTASNQPAMTSSAYPNQGPYTPHASHQTPPQPGHPGGSMSNRAWNSSNPQQQTFPPNVQYDFGTHPDSSMYQPPTLNRKRGHESFGDDQLANGLGYKRARMQEPKVSSPTDERMHIQNYGGGNEFMYHIKNSNSSMATDMQMPHNQTRGWGVEQDYSHNSQPQTYRPRFSSSIYDMINRDRNTYDVAVDRGLADEQSTAPNSGKRTHDQVEGNENESPYTTNTKRARAEGVIDRDSTECTLNPGTSSDEGTLQGSHGFAFDDVQDSGVSSTDDDHNGSTTQESVIARGRAGEEPPCLESTAGGDAPIEYDDERFNWDEWVFND